MRILKLDASYRGTPKAKEEDLFTTDIASSCLQIFMVSHSTYDTPTRQLNKRNAGQSRGHTHCLI